MKFSAPTQLTWVISIIVGILGVLASLVVIPVLSGFALWIVVLAWLILVVATMVKGV